MKNVLYFIIFALMLKNAVAGCGTVDRATFKAAAEKAASETAGYGFDNPMWATMVDETGIVCHILAVSTLNPGENVKGKKVSRIAWLGGRVMSAQKAFTANAFSTNNSSISSGTFYSAVLPNGFLYGLQHSNPVHPGKAYNGDPLYYGKVADPIIGKRLGGINVNGGGVALYQGSVKKGAIGVSGDTSCRDHMFAYRMRIALGLADGVPNDDGLILVATDPANLFEHPQCSGGEEAATNGTLDSGANDFSGSDFGIRNL